MSQTSYPTTMTIGIIGALADAADNTIETYANGESSAEIPFGAAVKQKVAAGADEAAIKTTADSDEIVGVVLHSHAYSKGGLAPDLGTVGLVPKATMNVLRKGRVYVKVGAAVTKGARAYFQTTTQLWRATAVGGDTIDATKQAVFRTAAAINGTAVLEVDFVNKP